MSKKIASDEIDLLDVILIVWRKKWAVFFIILISLALMFSYLRVQPEKKTIALTEVRPLTVYDEAKYKIYNLFINTIKPDYLKKNNQPEISNDQSNQLKIGKNIKIVNEEDVNDLEINNINKEFLFNLFIDRLNQKSNLIKGIKKFKLIKEKDYINNVEYEEAVNELATSFSLQNTEQVNLEEKTLPVIIKYEAYNTKDWENFLKFMEKETNIEIQKKLSEMLINYINYVKTIKNFELEDIDTQLAANNSEVDRNRLKKEKNILLTDKYIERMQSIFSSSPISKSNEFYAAKIVYDSTSYNTASTGSSKQIMYIIASLFGAIIGIFFVLIANAIQSRK